MTTKCNETEIPSGNRGTVFETCGERRKWKKIRAQRYANFCLLSCRRFSSLSRGTSCRTYTTTIITTIIATIIATITTTIIATNHHHNHRHNHRRKSPPQSLPQSSPWPIQATGCWMQIIYLSTNAKTSTQGIWPSADHGHCECYYRRYFTTCCFSVWLLQWICWKIHLSLECAVAVYG